MSAFDTKCYTPVSMLTPCVGCAALEDRLTQAKTHFRAQRSEITRLQDLLDRHVRIGLHVFRTSQANTVLQDTETLYENTILRRAVEQRDAVIQRQASIIAYLQTLLAVE